MLYRYGTKILLTTPQHPKTAICLWRQLFFASGLPFSASCRHCDAESCASSSCSSIKKSWIHYCLTDYFFSSQQKSTQIAKWYIFAKPCILWCVLKIYVSVESLPRCRVPAVGVLSAAVAKFHGPRGCEGLRHHPLRRLHEVVAVDLLEHSPRALHVLQKGCSENLAHI